jgi:U3 small nucleolar RNA-associated protein 14
VTRKVKKSDDESEEDIPPIPMEKSDNPWLGGSESSRPTNEITSGYRKLWDTVNKSKEIKKSINESTIVTNGKQKKNVSEGIIKANAKPRNTKQTVEIEDEGGDPSASDSDDNESITSDSPEMPEEYSEELSEGLVRKSTMEDFEQQDEEIKEKKTQRMQKSKRKSTEEKVSKVTKNEKEAKLITDIDPFKFISMSEATVLNSSVPVTEEGNEEEEDEELQRRMTLAEAFADDDVIEEFKEEKKQVVNASAPKDIDLTLPGWGEWGGSGLKISKRKKSKFIIKAPPAPKRRDDNRANVIINEDKNINMRRQQVSA